MISSQYLPLQRPSDIRVLFINPTVNNIDPLSGKLVHISLDDDPVYDALSYTWGSPELCRNIALDGAGLAITANLDLALRRMRARTLKLPTVIWADGICVNQADVPEWNKANNDFLASWRGSETQIKLYYKFERRKEFVVVLEVEGSYFTLN